MSKLSGSDVGMRRLFLYTNKDQMQRFDSNVCLYSVATCSASRTIHRDEIRDRDVMTLLLVVCCVMHID